MEERINRNPKCKCGSDSLVYLCLTHNQPKCFPCYSSVHSTCSVTPLSSLDQIPKQLSVLQQILSKLKTTLQNLDEDDLPIGVSEGFDRYEEELKEMKNKYSEINKRRKQDFMALAMLRDGLIDFMNRLKGDTACVFPVLWMDFNLLVFDDELRRERDEEVLLAKEAEIRKNDYIRQLESDLKRQERKFQDKQDHYVLRIKAHEKTIANQENEITSLSTENEQLQQSLDSNKRVTKLKTKLSAKKNKVKETQALLEKEQESKVQLEKVLREEMQQKLADKEEQKIEVERQLADTEEKYSRLCVQLEQVLGDVGGLEERLMDDSWIRDGIGDEEEKKGDNEQDSQDLDQVQEKIRKMHLFKSLLMQEIQVDLSKYKLSLDLNSSFDQTKLEKLSKHQLPSMNTIQIIRNTSSEDINKQLLLPFLQHAFPPSLQEFYLAGAKGKFIDSLEDLLPSFEQVVPRVTNTFSVWMYKLDSSSLQRLVQAACKCKVVGLGGCQWEGVDSTFQLPAHLSFAIEEISLRYGVGLDLQKLEFIAKELGNNPSLRNNLKEVWIEGWGLDKEEVQQVVSGMHFDDGDGFDLKVVD